MDRAVLCGTVENCNALSWAQAAFAPVLRNGFLNLRNVFLIRGLIAAAELTMLLGHLEEVFGKALPAKLLTEWLHVVQCFPDLNAVCVVTEISGQRIPGLIPALLEAKFALWRLVGAT